MNSCGHAASRGRYLYCVVDGAWSRNLGDIGIEESSVYTVAYRDLSATVHKCRLTPYVSKDAMQVQQWVAAHHRVVKTCYANLGTTIPVAFDTIIKGDNDAVKGWLNSDYWALKDKLRRLRGKAEFDVQIFWNPKAIGDRLTHESDKLKDLQRQREKSSEGLAYILGKQVEQELMRELERKGEQYVRDFYSQIAGTVDDIRLERRKRFDGPPMLMNLSVLASSEREKLLKETLARIEETSGVGVKLAGPWPPYSFV